MRIIIRNADERTDTWLALLGAYTAFKKDNHESCVYTMTNGVVISVERNKASITLRVQPGYH